MKHLVLLGDSVFDNGVYVSPGPDVIRQLQQKLPTGDKATLLAVDGNLTHHVAAQLTHLPAEATHLFVSVGGNDALQQSSLLFEASASMAHALNRLANVGAAFEANYRAMVQEVLAQKLPATLCTIYDPRFEDAMQQRISVTALAIFNNVILRTAFGAGLPVLDLRLICNEAGDYANEIEPSCGGGDKITARILQVALAHDFAAGRTQIFA